MEIAKRSRSIALSFFFAQRSIESLESSLATKPSIKQLKRQYFQDETKIVYF